MPRIPDALHSNYVKTPWAVVYLNGPDYSVHEILQISAVLLTLLAVSAGVVAKLIEGDWIDSKP